MFGIAPIAQSTPRIVAADVASTTTTSSKTRSPSYATAVSSTPAVINAPQGAGQILRQAGYIPVDSAQNTPKTPKNVHWSIFAPPLPPTATHRPWADYSTGSLLVRPDVVRLPRRIFATSDPENIDLRIAFTDAEVAYAESTLTNMKTYEDIVKQTGPGGTLITAAQYNSPDAHWAHAIQHAEQAKEEITRITNLVNAVIAAAPPPYIRAILEESLQEAKRCLKSWTDVLEENIIEVRIAVRRAHLLLRNYDLRTERYGPYPMSRLSKEEKEKRKGLMCEACGQKGHWQVDHTLFTCIHCKKNAPHHYATDCPSKPQKPHHSPRNHRHQQKKKMPELMDIDEEWKFDSGWNDDGDIQFEDEGNGWD